MQAGAGTRSWFVRRTAIVAGGTAAGLGVLGALADDATPASPQRDAQIFQFALLLEQLQAAFYEEALAHGALSGELHDFATTVAAHEREHVRVLRHALGSSARPAPAFRFRSATRKPDAFATTAARLEDLGVSAYNGQAGNLTKPALAAAAEIVSVDARHAGWIRAIRGQDPAPDATDRALTAQQVQAALKKTGFM